MEIELQEFEGNDYSTLIDWINLESEIHFLQWGGRMAFDTFPIDNVQLEKHIEGTLGNYAVRRIFKVVNVGSADMVGYIELNNINLRDRSAQVSRVLVAPSFRGKGIGYKMVKRVVEIGFDEIKLHRISLGVFDFNKGAIACYKKVGFKQDGILRDCMKVGTEFWSAVQMSILEDEWGAELG